MTQAALQAVEVTNNKKSCGVAQYVLAAAIVVRTVKKLEKRMTKKVVRYV